MAELGIDRGVPGRRRRAGRLHQGPARAIPRAPAASSSATPSTASRVVVRADRRAEPEPHPALPGAARQEVGRGGRTDQRGARRARAGGPIVYLEAPPRPPRDLAATTARADFCMVTSLHDGMNLVAKEFVAARDDDDGVLILSRFTGASRELRDASWSIPTTWTTWPSALYQVAHRRCAPSGARAWRGCARRYASTTSSAGPACCMAELTKIPQPASRPPRLSVVELTGVKIAPAAGARPNPLIFGVGLVAFHLPFPNPQRRRAASGPPRKGGTKPWTTRG